MRRLPLHRQFDSSQTALIALEPVWTKWVKQTLTPELTKTIKLTHYKDGELTLHCESAIGATQVNQHQQRLLQYLNQKQCLNIKDINVRISKLTNNSKPTNNTESVTSCASVDKNTVNRRAPNQITLNSIKSCEKMIDNDHLSNSLKRLIETVQHLSEKDKG